MKLKKKTKGLRELKISITKIVNKLFSSFPLEKQNSHRNNENY
jgi:hypothetical protein